MNEAVANILKDLIMGIPMADRVAGLVRPVNVLVNDVQKRFPVAWDVSESDIRNGRYIDLCPDSKRKSIMYFEDIGTQMIERKGDYQYFSSQLKLVGWLNSLKFAQFRCPNPLSTQMILEIINAFPAVTFNQGGFQRVQINVNSEAIKNNSIFGGYTYNEELTQYLYYPYDYFALNINVLYGYNFACD